MARTLAQIQAQITKLKQEADALRAKEVSGVVARIQEAIAHYGLTPQDLFGNAPAKGRGKAAIASKRAAKGSVKKPASAPKYRDEAGNTWTGHGKRPNWFKAALEAGKTAADLEIKG
jgi:DNA-binding protein H-NS